MLGHRWRTVIELTDLKSNHWVRRGGGELSLDDEAVAPPMLAERYWPIEVVGDFMRRVTH